jgi:hypothetical protein
MKTLFFAPLILFAVSQAAVICLGQTANPGRLKFKGVGLDSTYAQVVKALGRPEKDEAAKDEACIGGHEKTVTYRGVSLYFMDGDSKSHKTFEVKSFEITGAEYIVSGVKIGDTETFVKKIFGARHTVDTDPAKGEKTWLYSMSNREGPGTTRFVFRKGRIVKIASDFQVC